MKVIFLSDNGRHHKKIQIKSWIHIFLPLSLLCLLTIVVISSTNIFSNSKQSYNTELLNRFDLLLTKVSKLELQLQRSHSLKTISVDSIDNDIKTIIFKKLSALIEMSKFYRELDSLVINEADLVISIQEIESKMAEQKLKFNNDSNILMAKPDNKNTNILKAVHFYSSPVEKGYVSSNYGQRRDPLNGRTKHHNGIDIAAMEGSNIHAIASGFVTFTGKKGGYGNVIEIHHSDSLKSRYAHLNQINIEKGDVIRKGDIIATMGKTGRATGTHLHLEVWKNKQPIDPESFIGIALTNISQL